jgi:hypothetical protein
MFDHLVFETHELDQKHDETNTGSYIVALVPLERSHSELADVQTLQAVVRN